MKTHVKTLLQSTNRKEVENETSLCQNRNILISNHSLDTSLHGVEDSSLRTCNKQGSKVLQRCNQKLVKHLIDGDFCENS